MHHRGCAEAVAMHRRCIATRVRQTFTDAGPMRRRPVLFPLHGDSRLLGPAGSSKSRVLCSYGRRRPGRP
eukprot:9498081-Pyramimonas_sp.AAC.3